MPEQETSDLASDEEALREGAIYAVVMNLAAKDKAWKAIKWAAAALCIVAFYQSSFRPLLWLIAIGPALWLWLINSARRFVRSTTGMSYAFQAAAHHQYMKDDSFKELVKARYLKFKVITGKV